LDQTPTQEIMQRFGFGDVTRERVGLTQSAHSSIAWWGLRFGCVAPNAGTLAPSLPAAARFPYASNDGPSQAFGPLR
jgi:hypothetical protein